MEHLLQRVRSRLFLTSTRQSLLDLDGAYRSRIRDRSMEFDQLREYVSGDEVRDIDWKASARSGGLLVKQFKAERRQRLLFVVDTGLNLQSVTAGGDSKLDVAVQTVGTLGYLGLRNRDEVVLVTGNGAGGTHSDVVRTEGGLELLLRRLDSQGSTPSSHSDLEVVLRHVRDHFHRGMLVVVIADEVEASQRLADLVRALSKRHEMVWFSMEEPDLADLAKRGSIVDAQRDTIVPSALIRRGPVQREWAASMKRNRDNLALILGYNRITHGVLRELDSLVDTLLRVLRRRIRLGL